VTVPFPVARVWPSATPSLERVAAQVRVEKLDSLVEHCP
jgi:hypothetical protein